MLDPLIVLNTGGIAVDLSATFRLIASQHVADLPLTADDITALAADGQWLPARRTPRWPAGLVAPPRQRLDGTWLQIAIQARGHSSQALTTIAKAALTGAIQHARPASATRPARLR
jgi:hypothetical protein